MRERWERDQERRRVEEKKREIMYRIRVDGYYEVGFWEK